MGSEWLYQIRIRLCDDSAFALRCRNKEYNIVSEILVIANRHNAKPVCTLDAFVGYVEEAEECGIEKYPLYHWTRNVIDNGEKRIKHSKSFAFYYNGNQIYDKEIALNLYQDLLKLYKEKKIEELKMIDSNPKNNPQPPKHFG